MFAVLFFLMMAVLGVGSGVALLSTINTILMDAFPRVPVLYMTMCTCSAGFLVGLVYVTPVRDPTTYLDYMRFIRFRKQMAKTDPYSIAMASN